ncbi:MAG: TfoX/Sxy family protein [Maritimibacter sp.]
MSVSQGEINFAVELFDKLGEITVRKMMGGASIYVGGQIFAIVHSDGRIFLKAKDEFAAELATDGAVKFEMEDGRGMNYWTLPEAALDDPELAVRWAQKALANL